VTALYRPKGTVIDDVCSKTRIVLALGALILPGVMCGTTTVASYPVVKPAFGRQVEELIGSDIVKGDQFGTSVAASGMTALVGADQWELDSPYGAGRAYMFSKTAGGWRQVSELRGSNCAVGDQFGESVALSGTLAVVGAPNHGGGRAFVFTKTALGWRQTAELSGSDESAGDFFGEAVGVSARTIVVGAPASDANAGRVYVFGQSSNGWKQVAELKGSDTVAGDSFGYAAISGATVVIGAAFHAQESGRAYVFTHSSNGWKQVAELKGSDTVYGDAFGSSVAIYGTTVVVGAIRRAALAGRAYVFTHSSSGWRQVAELKGSDTVYGDAFGSSMGIYGTTVVVGAFGRANFAGRAYVFTHSSDGWRQVAELKGSDTVAGDSFGSSVAVVGTTALVGAPDHANESGRAYTFAV
jgi:hypothetical protein